MTHMITRAIARCNPRAFGLSPERAIKKAQNAISKLAIAKPGLSEYLLIVAKSDRIVSDNGKGQYRSNGDMLCAIVRNRNGKRRIATMILRRSSQPTRLDGLRYVIVQANQVIVL